MFTVIVIYVNAHKRTTLRCQSELRADQPPASTTSFLSNLHSDLYIDKNYHCGLCCALFFLALLTTYTYKYTHCGRSQGDTFYINSETQKTRLIREKKKKKRKEAESSLERMLFRLQTWVKNTQKYKEKMRQWEWEKENENEEAQWYIESRTQQTQYPTK